MTHISEKPYSAPFPIGQDTLLKTSTLTINKFVSEREVYAVERNYRRNRSISGLRHLTVKIKSEGSIEYNDCTCVLYSISGENTTKSTDREG